jgi:hypothetical protein
VNQKIWKFVKWAIISLVLIFIASVAGWFGLVVYLFSGGCDEGPYSDWRSANTRGDVVAGYIRACTGIGTVVDHSIALQLHGEENWIKLVEHDDPMYHYPKFQWLNDDTLMIDLGKVGWINSPVYKLGSINIGYVYSMGEP